MFREWDGLWGRGRDLFNTSDLPSTAPFLCQAFCFTLLRAVHGYTAVGTQSCVAIQLWERRAVWLYSCGNVELWGYITVGTQSCVAIQLWERRAVGLYNCGNTELSGYTAVGT